MVPFGPSRTSPVIWTESASEGDLLPSQRPESAVAGLGVLIPDSRVAAGFSGVQNPSAAMSPPYSQVCLELWAILTTKWYSEFLTVTISSRGLPHPSTAACPLSRAYARC